MPITYSQKLNPFMISWNSGEYFSQDMGLRVCLSIRMSSDYAISTPMMSIHWQSFSNSGIAIFW